MHALDWLAPGSGRANVVDVLRREHEAAVQRGARRLPESHRRALIPHHVLAPEVLDQHNHVHTVAGGIHAAAEHRADIILGAPGQREPYADLTIVVRDVSNPCVHASVVWRDVEPAAL